MSVGIPGRRQHDSLLDIVMKGLDAAGKYYGMKEASEQAELLRKQREEEQATKQRLSRNEFYDGEATEKIYAKGGRPVDAGAPGAFEITILPKDDGGSPIKKWISFDKPQAPKIAPPTYKDMQLRDGSIVRVEADGSTKTLHKGRGFGTGAPKEEVFTYTDSKGNERAGKKVAGKVVQDETSDVITKPAAFTTAGTKLTPEQQSNEDIAKKFETQAATSLGVSNMIKAEAAKVQQFLDQGNTGQAVAAAKNMVKTLNSTFGPDATGVEEVNRLAARLNNLRGDFLGDNYGIGPDIKGFVTQALGKAESVSQGAAENFKMAEQARKGSLKGGLVADAPPPKTKAEEGTAQAAPAKNPQLDAIEAELRRRGALPEDDRPDRPQQRRSSGGL